MFDSDLVMTHKSKVILTLKKSTYGPPESFLTNYKNNTNFLP